MRKQSTLHTMAHVIQQGWQKVPFVFLLLGIWMLASCSTTSSVPDDDQLFVGLKKINYTNYEKNKQFTTTSEEVEAALATAPNGALFGSSYYRTPFPYRLWIYNAFAGSDGKISAWITKTFGKAPVLMSNVNPQLRASVAQSVLRNHGYLNSSVEYKLIKQKNPKKVKVEYTVNMGHLYTIDTLHYVNFPSDIDSIIQANKGAALIKSGSPFDAATMDAERERLAKLFKNNGYYYYQSSYASYLADTFAVAGKVHLRLQMADNIGNAAKHKWYIGNLNMNIRKQYMEPLRDSIVYRSLHLHFNGRKPPIRARVILRDLKLWPRQMFNYGKYLESANKLNSSGLFNSIEFGFTPRDTTAMCDTLDLNLTCTFGKPYDFYVETNYTNKINGRTGPELVVGFTKRNAFRGGEKIDINLHGSYEWQKGGDVRGKSSDLNSYEYGADASIEFPRLLVPFLKRRLYQTTPSTYAKVSSNVLKRPSYFKMHTVSGEWTYKWQRTLTQRHEFSPLTLQYQKLNYTTERFDSIVNANPYLEASMQNVFIPKMRYSFTYSSVTKHRNPIVWSTTLTESGNVLSLVNMAAGKKWGTVGKQLFQNPYAQFIKLETDFTKIWQTGQKAQLVAHVNGGIAYSYGNSRSVPYSEQFYVGGANSVRAFSVRSLGPGSYTTETRHSYLDQTGDIKLQLNLEYRFNMFDNLYGAAFLDAGNVWSVRNDSYRPGAQFKLQNVPKEMALGIGVGLRYDLEFLVIRVDWGIGLHVPYETGKSGYFNIPKFKNGQALHFAVGYPF